MGCSSKEVHGGGGGGGGGGVKDTLMIFIAYNGLFSFVLEIVRGVFKDKEGKVCWFLVSMGRLII